MSADLNTSITVKGNEEELLAILKILSMFENENCERYRTKHDCAYFDCVYANGKRIKDLSDEATTDFLKEAEGELQVEASGPYGVFDKLCEVGLFEAMADAAPGAWFRGNSSGFVTGADVSLDAELKDGTLHLAEYYMADEVLPDEYKKIIQNKLPYEQFCKLFKIDEGEFDEECYLDFIEEAIGECGFPDMDYDQFIEYCESSSVSEDEYDQAVGQIQSIDLMDFDTFRDTIDEEEYTEHRVYDPTDKKR